MHLVFCFAEQGLFDYVTTRAPLVASMSCTTLEVEIEHGTIVPKEPQILPEKGSGFLTILHPSVSAGPRPLGLAEGEFSVPVDFNAPLPEDVLCGQARVEEELLHRLEREMDLDEARLKR